MSAAEAVSCDALVVGAGAAGMSAAIAARLNGLDVLIVEKAAAFGGTTALSGGAAWIPCNSLARRDGIADSIAAARTYLEQEAGVHFDAERVDAYLSGGPRMIDFFARNTPVRFVADHQFPDYHPDRPGGIAGGRSLWAAPFDARALGARFANLVPPLPQYTFLGMGVGSGVDYRHFMNAQRSLRSALHVAGRVAEYGAHRIRYGHGLRLFNGNALAARLGKSVFDRKIPLWLSTPVQELIQRDGAVRGAILLKDGAPVRVVARRGVVLACGGFSHDPARRGRLFSPLQVRSLAPLTNTGDGLRLAERAGAEVTADLDSIAYAAPVSRMKRPDGSEWLVPHFTDRGKPGVIAVTCDGKRFVNESESYHDVARALIRKGVDGDRVRAFLVCDHRAIRRYGLGYAKPFPVPLTSCLRSGYLLRAGTLAALAAMAGIDPAALAATVDAFNRDARNGRDGAFGKGSSAYNRFQGDAAHRPNPCLAPLETPPLYAVGIEAADLGTFAGIRTNGRAQALTRDGHPVPGLYAAGNDAASVFGGSCPGGGSTIGPAMTFGYIAGCHLAGVEG